MRLSGFLLAAGCLLTVPALAADPIKIIGVLELSGAGASVGTAYKNGLEMAAEEINKSGGVLGRKLDVRFYDTQTNPGVARGQMQKALDENPLVLVGPTYSGSVRAAMPIAQKAEIPEFTGGAAAQLTELGNPYIFRTLGSQRNSVPKVVNYLAEQVHARTVGVIYANTDLGKGGRDVFLQSAKDKGMEVLLDLSSEQGQADFASDVLKFKSAGLDAIFLSIHEEEVARFLKEGQRQGLKTPIFGEQTLLNPIVLQLAGDAGVGAKGYIPLTGDAPVPTLQDLSSRFAVKFGYTPDHNGFQGYIVGYVIRTVLKKTGKIDPKLFAETLHGLTITAEEEPGVLLTTTWDKNGDINRAGFLAVVEKDNTLRVEKILPRAGE
ncbi:ABC transporter substrate-binding protein [Azospirillum endophyticum]